MTNIRRAHFALIGAIGFLGMVGVLSMLPYIFAERAAKSLLGTTFRSFRMTSMSPSASKGLWMLFEAERTSGDPIRIYWHLTNPFDIGCETY